MMVRSSSLVLIFGLLFFGQIQLTLSSYAATSASSNHWAFQPIGNPTPPETRNATWAQSPIDDFILRTLQDNGLTPSAPADPYTLLRRIHFTLTGLPPTPDEIQTFIRQHDAHPSTAITQRIDELLNSPQYGERWGRWWLDVARYADSNGQDENKVMANAWRYRDWVVRAFNQNQPFHHFITEQLAGDLLPSKANEDERDAMDRITATGFLVLGPKMLAEQDKPKLVMDIVDEQIDTIGRAFLGLTLGCARCHDHKFDPVPAQDYYAMAGIFKSTRTMEDLAFVSKFNERPVSTAAQREALTQHHSKLSDWTNRYDAAIREANATLQAQWKKNFPTYLVAASPAASSNNLAASATNANLNTNILNRLQSLLTTNSESSTVQQTLLNLAQSPDSASNFLRSIQEFPQSVPGGRIHLTRGKVGPGFRAHGTNSLDLPHSLELDSAQLSVEVWVQTDTFADKGETRRWLINKNGNEWVEGHYALLLDGRKAVAYLNIGGGSDHVYSVTSRGDLLKRNQWHHLALTYDGSILRLFVDGQPAGETPVNKPRKAGTTSLALARRQDGYIHFEGKLDEARVYNLPLPPKEIAAHYSKPGSKSAVGLVAEWNFNEVSPTEQQQLNQEELYETLFGKKGVFALPPDPKPLYPAQVRAPLAQLEKERDALIQSAPPALAFAMAVAEDKPVEVPIHLRGSHLNLAKDPVPRGFIQVLNSKQTAPTIPKERSGRLQLAEWLTSPDQPLTARVTVNRIWQAHFGHGLVRTPENFGLRGEPPSHPELLDWLARQLIKSDWNIKALHRLILSSAVYQQSSTSSRIQIEKDPENRLLTRFPRQRLEAEMVRDAILATSGQLDRSQGGSLVDWKNNEYVPSDEVSSKSLRRTLYLPIVRDRVFDALTIFDFANPSVCTSQRTPTVVSHQALFFLNSPMVQDAARHLAQSALKDAQSPNAPDDHLLHNLYLQILNRPASTPELRRSLEFLKSMDSTSTEKDPKSRSKDGLAALIQALMASNDFIYRD